VAVINLAGLAGGGDQLLVAGQQDLQDLFLRSAQGSIPATAEQGLVPRSYQTAFGDAFVSLGWDPSALTLADDTFSNLDLGKLSVAGQALNLALITLAREYAY